MRVNCCAFSPDGRRIVSGGFDNTLKVWDADSGAVLRTLTGHTGEVAGCAFSPDGHRIVSASWDQTLKVWDADSGTDLSTLTGHTGVVAGCAFSPDGRWIVSTSDARTLRVSDSDSGSLVAQIGLPGNLWCVSWHPWRAWMACGDSGGVLYWVEVVGIEPDPVTVTATERGPQLVVRCPACQSDHPFRQEWQGQDIDCPTQGCGLSLRVNPLVRSPSTLSSPAPLSTLSGHSGFSPDGHQIVSASTDLTLNRDADDGSGARTSTGVVWGRSPPT